MLTCKTTGGELGWVFGASLQDRWSWVEVYFGASLCKTTGGELSGYVLC